ncbi:hypothetical protein [Garciella nitratireducens]|uniref:Uncharacterized protein n=1 Tax=Garciella nitratireducens DSM 15102 TaxID=1121911 RepID=A0A1T4NNH9_9FIRM|nr:hypothetical protein [Garciella nitratireducens]RBP44798.1 hypothetical protein DFR81_104122 [Garciella nitratireducens]SJZ80860.1 hypothetical protein SAMN02745973_01745 [Garciella nitratireducens DSM 15102]
MYYLVSSMIHNFFVAFGVVIGASLFNGFMIVIANSIKLWIIAITIGEKMKFLR